MSNYFVAVGDRHARHRIRSWLRSHAVPRSDVYERRVGRRTMFLVAREVHRGMHGRHFGIGTMVDHERELVSFGVDSWRAHGVTGPSADTTGEFVSIEWDHRRVRIVRDLLGSVPIVYTHGDGFAAASDSLLLLRELRDSLGAPNTPDHEVALARSRTLAVTGQQMSTRTMLQEVLFCPAGRGLELPVAADTRPRTVGRGLPERVARVQDGRTELLRRAAGGLAGVIRALGHDPHVVLRLALSGGLDSRLMLAAARRAGVGERLQVVSWNNSSANAPDYACAEALCGWAGLALNPTVGGPVAERHFTSSGLSIFATTHLGLYDRVLPISGRLSAPERVNIGGLGAGLMKGGYGHRSVPEMGEYLTRERPDASVHASERQEAVMAQLRRGVADVGGDPDRPGAMEWHYASYRAGLHGGVHVPLAMTSVKPLQQLNLVALGHRPDAGPGPVRYTQASRGILDMMVLLDAPLAVLPYASPAPGVTAEQAQSLVTQLGGPLTDAEIPDATVRGRIDQVGGGPHRLGISVAARRGLGVPHDIDLVALSQPWADAIACERTRDVHQDLGRLTTSEMVRREGRHPADAGPGPAKRLSAVLLS